ncbi:DUF554 domain-containing protein [Hornefia butyriciproducens]|uniref:DUF554 domain-containing protein n=1 Tax=Hornefia butyriciproducens TaxID=2652293 RepID=UPI003F894EE3
MIIVIINALAVIFCGFIGLTAKKIIPNEWNDIIMKGIGLVNIYIGTVGALKGDNTLILILSIILGAMIGQSLRLEQRFNNLANRLQKRFDKSSNNSSQFAQAFVTASLLMCVGAISIVGSLNAGINGDYDLLLTKSAMDGITSVMLATSMGIGVLFAAFPIFLVQGGIVLLAGFLAPLLTDQVINMMTCTGSLLIIALAFNIVCETKLKILNYMPAVFLPVILIPVSEWISGMIG